MLAIAAGLAGIAAWGSAPPTAGSDGPVKIDAGALTGVLVLAHGSVWTTDLVLNRLVRIDPATARVTGKARLGSGRTGSRPAPAASGWRASRATRSRA